MIRITALGIATSVQDFGRPGRAALGIARSGAADRNAHALANRLVGNDPARATIETSGGLRFTVVAPVVAAVTGASCAIRVQHGPPLGLAAPQALPAGSEISIAPARAGVRAYLSLRGGVATPEVLGSRSRDTLARLGHELSVGDVIATGPDPGTPIPADVAPQREWASRVVVVPGPRVGWFAADALAVLTGQDYTVDAASNRVGVRLRGHVDVRRVITEELPSEGLVLGAVQIPPDGQPIVMLADHPVTGGYPVLAVVADESLSSIAQAAAGSTVTFALAVRRP